ncbi:GIY-YIG nuclease family protein [Streptomyces liliifuscus]|uniref:GIY-YIG nuclease family protein n=1 Tax=Streptomyces liliifuscus TaxID=2797636 RepID=A0A7T7L2B9_9ACTN|nr:GIY-YIG nuclease family protein [Streptomyces liliifuscus]QQM45155.1 GIY-YIG nuclease family protein [Streptomyces liliifuscus]
MPQTPPRTPAPALRIPYIKFHEPDKVRTLLYRFFDDEGRLLYVGITNNPQNRWADHAHKARINENVWWHLVRVVHTEWCDTRGEAEAAEITAIRHERPLHNGSHNVRLGAGLRFRSMYLHPMAREIFGDKPFTLHELADRAEIPVGTARLYARRLVAKGAFQKIGSVKAGPRNRPRLRFVALDVPPDVASPVQSPLLDME